MIYSVFLPIIIIIYSIAIVSTVFRLAYRIRYKMLWWDDFWAAFSLINAIILFAAHIQITFGLPGAWLSSFPCVMVTSRLATWAARLSVAVTIVRVIAVGTSRLVSKIVAVIFALLGATLTIQKMVLCRKDGPQHLCATQASVTGFTDLSATFLSDLWLLGAPAYLLWKMNLKKRFHRLLQAIFACELLVLVTSIVQSIYIVKRNLPAQVVLTHLKVGIPLIVCNLLFLVTYIYRLSQNGEHPEDSTTTAPTRPPNCTSYTTTTSSQMLSTGRSTVQTQVTSLTSVLVSSHAHVSVNSNTLAESEPGIIERGWPSANGIRFVSSV